MYKICTVTRWSDKRDSAYRVAIPKESSREILLNPSHISDLLADPSDASKSIFKFFDNPADRRESYSTIWANETVASIIAANDVAFHSNMITLDIHRNNNPDKPTVATTIPVESIAWADRYNLDNQHCWVIYYGGAFKRHEVLADLSIEDLIDKARTGTTTTTGDR